MLYSCNILGTKGRWDGGRGPMGGGSKAEDKGRGTSVRKHKQPFCIRRCNYSACINVIILHVLM